jgi:hypothetical protein
MNFRFSGEPQYPAHSLSVQYNVWDFKPVSGEKGGGIGMSYYVTRVELHYATYEDYENLHGAMQRARFSRVIVGDDGQTYHLPTAEYVMVGDYDVAAVRRASAQAAATTGKKFAVVVTQGASLSWEGLAAA